MATIAGKTSLNAEKNSRLMNHELTLLLEDLSRAHNNLENLLAAIDIAALILDQRLNIIRFTPKLTETFDIKASDRECPISDVRHNLVYDDLESDVRKVLANLTPIEHEVGSHNGRLFILRINPFSRGDYDSHWVVITLIDISRIKPTENLSRANETRVTSELKAMRRLHQMTLTIASAGNMQQALDEILLAAIEVLGVDFGNVQLFDTKTSRLKIAARQGFSSEMLEPFAALMDGLDSVCRSTLQQQKTCLIEDVFKDNRFTAYREFIIRARICAIHAKPLITREGKVVGVLSMYYGQPHMFSQWEIQLADLLATKATYLIASRSQQQELQELYHKLKIRSEALEASQKELLKTTEELSEHDRRKEDFLASLGHELRNPLAGIRNTLAAIKTNGKTTPEAISILDRQSQHMNRLIDDLLDVARVNRGSLLLARAPMPLGLCLQDAADNLQGLVDAKGLMLTLTLPEDDIYVDADNERLLQIVDNLLRNAIMYTPAGGTIELSLSAENGNAKIQVRDTGCGINAETLKTLFEPFYQDDRSRLAGGLGLGLTLAKRLVLLHGGTISAASEGANKGSEFTVLLPQIVHNKANTKWQSDFEPPPGLNVLVIDDQADIANSFAMLLQHIGQTVRVAYSAMDALKLVEAQPPDVAFLDIALPDVTGDELAHRLREHFSRDKLTLVALSGYAPKSAEHNGVFDHCLLKPVNLNTIITLLNGVSKTRQ